MAVLLYKNLYFSERRNIVTLGIYSRICRHVEAPAGKKRYSEIREEAFSHLCSYANTLFIYSSTGTYLQSSASR